MWLTKIPVRVVTKTGRAAKLLAGAFPTAVNVAVTESPLEAVAACVEAPPTLLVVEMTSAEETWIPALRVLSELPAAPRRLFLAEPGILEEILHETFHPGRDHIVLWPCSEAELREGFLHMVGPTAGDYAGVPSLNT